jgi:tRNA(Ile)-lysidine synthase TilS/MesJ
VAYSGGKDSTFTLNLMKTKYNLRVLALSFDNWFQSERAQMNIRNVVERLCVDHITVRPKFDAIKRMIEASVSTNLYSSKAVERASAICTTCMALIRFASIKLAVEKSIPFVVTGLSPGQAPLVTSVFKTNGSMLRKMQDAIYQPLHKYAGDSIGPCFLESRHFEDESKFPYSINPLAFHPYDEGAFIQVAQGLGWSKPTDTDSNSTNCLLNSYANEVHIKQHGFHPYAYEIAGLVRQGYMAREEGLKKLSTPPDSKVVEYVKRKLGTEDSR